MAPESLRFGKFTIRSDVWSFGVLMWEITSLGERPYPTRTNEEAMQYVYEGGRLPKPLNCPQKLYDLMLNCWAHRAGNRPPFKECLQEIESLRSNTEDALLLEV